MGLADKTRTFINVLKGNKGGSGDSTQPDMDANPSTSTSIDVNELLKDAGVDANISADVSGSDEKPKRKFKLGGGGGATNKKAWLIRALVVIGLLAAFSEDIFKFVGMTPEVQAPVVQRPKRKRKARKPRPKTAAKKAQPAKKAMTKSSSQGGDLADIPKIAPEKTQRVEVPNNLQMKDPVVKQPTRPAPRPEPKIIPTPKTIVSAPPVNENKSREDLSEDFNWGNSDEAPIEETVTKKEENFEKVNLKDIRFDIVGRGLVYNCKDQHWACVDKQNYLKCKKSQGYLGSMGEKPECVVKEVYGNSSICVAAQEYKIENLASTDFCSF